MKEIDSLTKLQELESSILSNSNALFDIKDGFEEETNYKDILLEQFYSYDKVDSMLTEIKKYFNVEYDRFQPLINRYNSKLNMLVNLKTENPVLVQAAIDFTSLLQVAVLSIKDNMGFYLFEPESNIIASLLGNDIDIKYKRIRSSYSEDMLELFQLSMFSPSVEHLDNLRIINDVVRDTVLKTKEELHVVKDSIKNYTKECEQTQMDMDSVLIDLQKTLRNSILEITEIYEKSNSIEEEDDVPELNLKISPLLTRQQKFIIAGPNVKKPIKTLMDIDQDFDLTYRYWIYDDLEERTGVLSEFDSELSEILS